MKDAMACGKLASRTNGMIDSDFGNETSMSLPKIRLCQFNSKLSSIRRLFLFVRGTLKGLTRINASKAIAGAVARLGNIEEGTRSNKRADVPFPS